MILISGERLAKIVPKLWNLSVTELFCSLLCNFLVDLVGPCLVVDVVAWKPQFVDKTGHKQPEVKV